MTLDQIMEMSKRDMKLDDISLDLESLRTPGLFDKYLKIHTLLKRELKKIEKRYSKIKREKVLYYTGRADREIYEENPFDVKILKNELDTFMNGDDDMIKVQSEIDEMQLMFDYVERCLKNILERQWHIKNIIEWRKFTNGVS
tara:strand:+ start:10732 stop:11160 length:429 start_codon:yes stop_codon:yes gene_type:complete